MEGPNPLEEFPKLRRYLYRLLWIAGIITGLWQAASTAVPELSSPTSTKIVAGVLAVIAYLSVVSNYTADRNVGQAPAVQRVIGDQYVADHGKLPDVRDPRDGDLRSERGAFEYNIIWVIVGILAIIALGIYIVRAL